MYSFETKTLQLQNLRKMATGSYQLRTFNFILQELVKSVYPFCEALSVELQLQLRHCLHSCKGQALCDDILLLLKKFDVEACKIQGTLGRGQILSFSSKLFDEGKVLTQELHKRV